jgi:molybdate transport system ATP-binding protein
VTVVGVSASTTVGVFSVHADFEAASGITTLFGPSGSGKSVTLALVAGLLRPTSGTITIDGAIVADATTRVHVPTQDRRIGMVFQQATLLPHRTALDNVALAIRDGRDRGEARRRAAEWLERVSAGHLARKATGPLSGGEQQRVALARALAGSPRLLLLDEPFSALDLPTRISLRQLLRSLVDTEQITTILVTHDLDDVSALANRVIRYEPGRSTTAHDVQPGHPADLAHVLGLVP